MIEVKTLIRLIFVSCLVGSVMITNASQAADSDKQPAPLVHTIDFADAKNHYVAIRLDVPCAGKQSVELMMAVWTPGSYLVREYARNMEDVRATAGGKATAIEKKSKNRWTVNTGGADEVSITYRLYCREMSVRSNWADADFALINGAPTFLTLGDGSDPPHEIRLEMPDDWAKAVASLESVEDKTHRIFKAANFDELVDSPIVCGNPAVYDFSVGDVGHQLVNVGEGSVWDGPASADDVEKIVAEHQKMWGLVPYPRYVFFNLITEAGGGLEHDNSTVMMTSRWNYRDREKYVRWLGLVSHEFFHTWNVRRLRPRALVDYDYESEVYFSTLWIAEGITSYYDDLALVRSGLINRKEFFGLVSKQIERLQATPGRLVQSLTESSHDTWIKLYRPDENSGNSRVSYYNKGSVVAFLLDAEIRRRTEGEKSLDDVMRLLYKRHAGERGYLHEDFLSIVEEVSGSEFSDWFRANIDSAGELDYAPALDFYGLEIDEIQKSDNGDAGKNGKTWLGVTTKTSDGRLIVSKVLRDSPAWKAGINPDDELIAIEGFRVLPASFESRMKQYRAGDSLELLISRREKLTPLRVVTTERPKQSWKIEVSDDPTVPQTTRLDAWIGATEKSK